MESEDSRSATIFNESFKYLTSTLRQAFLLQKNLDRASWPMRLQDTRSAYTALRAHFLKYIEHPDDIPSTADPLAEDDNVGRPDKNDNDAIDLPIIVAMAISPSERDYSRRNISGRREMSSRKPLLSRADDETTDVGHPVHIREIKPRSRLPTRNA